MLDIDSSLRFTFMRSGRLFRRTILDLDDTTLISNLQLDPDDSLVATKHSIREGSYLS